MSPVIKYTVLQVARWTGLFAAARTLAAGSLRILAYHGVGDCPAALNRDGFQIDPAVFSTQLDHLVRAYHPVDLDAVCTALGGGNPLPRRAVLVTFDDGYANNAEVAAPLLRERGVPAVFFITTGYLDGTHRPWWYVLRQWIAEAGAEVVGFPNGQPGCDATAVMVAWEAALKRLTGKERAVRLNALGERLGRTAGDVLPFMTWDQVRDLRESGFAIEPHTVSHPNLGVEAPSTVQEEITGSISRLREETGIIARSFSYPYGGPDAVQPCLFDLLRTAGIRAAVTTCHGLNRPGGDPLLLHRLNITDGHRGPAFERLLAFGR
jgi:peptidoglycan/xylan/chitin deacetylase (PgdA/CDA1 family)